jgi:hypothetical protein
MESALASDGKSIDVVAPPQSIANEVTLCRSGKLNEPEEGKQTITLGAVFSPGNVRPPGKAHSKLP